MPTKKRTIKSKWSDHDDAPRLDREQELRDAITSAAPLTAAEKIALFRKIRAKSPPLKDFDIGAAIRAGRDDESLA